MALVKATSEAIGLTQLASGWGLELSCSVHVDSSAALAVTGRKGNGKLRHVRIGHLWVQELAEGEIVQFAKVGGESNPADLMTKYLPAAKMSNLLTALSQYHRAGHARCRLALDSMSDFSVTRTGTVGYRCGPSGDIPSGQGGVLNPSCVLSACMLGHTRLPDVNAPQPSV